MLLMVFSEIIEWGEGAALSIISGNAERVFRRIPPYAESIGQRLPYYSTTTC
jgi:hypothetical protein